MSAKAWRPETRYPEAGPGAGPPAAPDSRRGARAPPGAAPERPSFAAAAGAWPDGRAGGRAEPEARASFLRGVSCSRSLHPAPARRGASAALKETPSHFRVSDGENHSRRGGRCLQTERLPAGRTPGGWAAGKYQRPAGYQLLAVTAPSAGCSCARGTHAPNQCILPKKPANGCCRSHFPTGADPRKLRQRVYVIISIHPGVEVEFRAICAALQPARSPLNADIVCIVNALDPSGRCLR